MPYHLRPRAGLLVLLLLGLALHADEQAGAPMRGASVPWTTYEAEDMLISGTYPVKPR